MRDCRALPENLIETGLPRNDRLYRATDAEREAMREKLGLPADKRIILYAPTWRDSEDLGAEYKLAPPIDWKRWERELGDEYMIAIRSHWITTSLEGVDCESGFVRDFSGWSDANDLLIASDMLISDYSSIIFDYSVLCRPICCFGYDFDAYTAARPLYLDLETTLPSGVIRDEDALLAHIRSLDYESECAKTRALRNAHLNFGGEATRLCVEYLFSQKK